MEDSGEIVRIIQGMYSLHLFDDVFSLPILPSVDDVISCIARKHKWIICPTGNTALNIMGLFHKFRHHILTSVVDHINPI